MLVSWEREIVRFLAKFPLSVIAFKIFETEIIHIPGKVSRKDLRCKLPLQNLSFHFFVASPFYVLRLGIIWQPKQWWYPLAFEKEENKRRKKSSKEHYIYKLRGRAAMFHSEVVNILLSDRHTRKAKTEDPQTSGTDGTVGKGGPKIIYTRYYQTENKE